VAYTDGQHIYTASGQGSLDPKGVIRTLFQQGQGMSGAMSMAAKSDATVVSPPTQGGPKMPSNVLGGRREFDNPSQYPTPRAGGPKKPKNPAPSYESIADAILRVREGEDPLEVARALVASVAEQKEKMKKDSEDDDEEEGDEKEESTNESAKEVLEFVRGIMLGEDAYKTLPHGFSGGAGSAPTPPQDGAKGSVGSLRVSLDTSVSNAEDYVREWLKGIPVAKKVWAGNSVVHRVGEDAYQLDDISSKPLTLDAATKALMMVMNKKATQPANPGGA